MTTVNNAILVFEEDGLVKRRLCPEAEAMAFLEEASRTMKGASAFIAESWDAKLVLEISPDLRERVAAAETKLKADMRFRDALDRHGVPRDPDIRRAVFMAHEDVKTAA